MKKNQKDTFLLISKLFKSCLSDAFLNIAPLNSFSDDFIKTLESNHNYNARLLCNGVHLYNRYLDGAATGTQTGSFDGLVGACGRLIDGR